MKSDPAGRRTLLSGVLLPVLIGGLAVTLAGCGAANGDASSSKLSAASTASQNRVAIKSDGLAIEATTATAILRGYSPQPLSVRIMGGWVDAEKAKRAGQESDEAEQRKQAMASFGTLTVQVAAGKTEPGSYQLAPEGDSPDVGTVIIDKVKDAGLASDYTSQSGTLTIKSVAMSDGGSVTAIEGSFEGQFASEDGDSCAFSGNFRFKPKDQ